MCVYIHIYTLKRITTNEENSAAILMKSYVLRFVLQQ